MATKTVLKPGDVITYVSEDAGGLVHWTDKDGQTRGWTFKPTYAHISGRQPDEAELIIVDTDIPLAMCQSYVDSGRCMIVVDDPPAAEPETAEPPRPNSGGPEKISRKPSVAPDAPEGAGGG